MPDGLCRLQRKPSGITKGNYVRGKHHMFLNVVTLTLPEKSGQGVPYKILLVSLNSNQAILMLLFPTFAIALIGKNIACIVIPIC